MFGGFDAGIPALIIGFGMIFVGGPLVLFTWLRIAYGATITHRCVVPAPAYLLTGAVLAELLSMFTMRAVPPSTFYFASDAVWQIPILINFGLVIASVVCLRKYVGPESGILKVGAKLLLTIDAIGFLVFVIALPGMPLH